MNIQMHHHLNQSGLSRQQTQAPSRLNPRSEQTEVLFGGQGAKKKNWLKGLLASLMLVPGLLAGGVVSAQGQANQPILTRNNGGQTEICVNDSSDGALQFVDSASQLPLSRDSQIFGHSQFVVDLCNNPLLSAESRAALNRVLADFMNTEHGQMAVVMIPDTHMSEINTLATDLFNQIGIGDDAKDNGILLLNNVAAIRENRSAGRMRLVPGSGIDHQITSQVATDILVQNALPSLRQGNYDAAVQNTVNAVTQFMNSPASVQKAGTIDIGQWIQEHPKEALVIAVVVIVVLLLLLAMLDEGGGGYSGGGGYYSSGGGSWGGGGGSSGGGGFGGGSSGGGGGGI